MPTDNTAPLARPCAVAEVAILDRPGHLAVVAHTAIAAPDDVIHGHVVCTGTHFETQFMVADLAPKADTVERLRQFGRETKPPIIMRMPQDQYDRMPSLSACRFSITSPYSAAANPAMNIMHTPIDVIRAN